jgi:hypothetical protein
MITFLASELQTVILALNSSFGIYYFLNKVMSDINLSNHRKIIEIIKLNNAMCNTSTFAYLTLLANCVQEVLKPRTPHCDDKN